jgi:hypothetical protein
MLLAISGLLGVFMANGAPPGIDLDISLMKIGF